MALDKNPIVGKIANVTYWKIAAIQATKPALTTSTISIFLFILIATLISKNIFIRISIFIF
jgi:hypothetical protein